MKLNVIYDICWLINKLFAAGTLSVILLKINEEYWFVWQFESEFWFEFWSADVNHSTWWCNCFYAALVFFFTIFSNSK